MSNYIYYSLIHKKHPVVELLACIDLDTIEDDEPEVEYKQNDSYWDNNRPSYWKVDGVEYPLELDELKGLEVFEWDWISQALVDCEDSFDEVFIREFENATIYISYDRDFSSETAKKLPSGAIVENDYPFKERVWNSL